MSDSLGSASRPYRPDPVVGYEGLEYRVDELLTPSLVEPVEHSVWSVVIADEIEDQDRRLVGRDQVDE